MSDYWPVTGKELLRQLRRLAQDRGVEVRFDSHRGKGDHGTIRFGGRRTILGGVGEIKKGTLMAMLKDLGITLDDLRG